MSRLARKDAIRAVLDAPVGVLEGLCDLLTWELTDAYSEMEAANDNMTMWRSQGKALEARNLINLLKLKGRTENE